MKALTCCIFLFFHMKAIFCGNLTVNNDISETLSFIPHFPLPPLFSIWGTHTVYFSANWATVAGCWTYFSASLMLSHLHDSCCVCVCVSECGVFVSWSFSQHQWQWHSVFKNSSFLKKTKTKTQPKFQFHNLFARYQTGLLTLFTLSTELSKVTGFKGLNLYMTFLLKLQCRY